MADSSYPINVSGVFTGSAKTMDVASFMFQRFRQCGHIVAIHVVEVDEQRDPLDSNNPRASGVGGVKISFDDQDSVRRALGLVSCVYQTLC